MKCFKFFVFSFLLILLSCTANDDKHDAMDSIIKQAESMYQHPDGERFATYDYDSLQIQHEIMSAAKHYVSAKDYEKAAKAFLYCGYAQKENDDNTSAMKSFKDAEKYGNLSHDSLTIARSNYNIARLLFIDKMWEESIPILLTADNYMGNHYDEKSWCNNLIALSYCFLKDYKNAEIYIKKGYEYAKSGKSSRAIWSAINNQAVIFREEKEYDKALRFLLKNKNEIDSATYIMYNHNMGKICIYSNNYDSAYFYTRKALELSQSVKIKPETEASIYFSLYYIAKKQGNYQEAIAYLEKNETLRYQILKEKEKKNLYRIQRQYDYEALQNRMNQKIIEKQRIILMISYLLLLAAIVVIGLLVRQRKILKEDERIKKELDITKEELQKSSVKAEVVEEELSRELRLIITANHIARQADDFKKEWSTLVYKINHEKDNMFGAAVAAIERVYPSMYDSIIKKYPALNETESKVMLLSCSDLTNKEIAHILNLSIHTVNKSRSEINKKISSLMEVNASSADMQ